MHRYLVVADLAVGTRELKDFVRSRDDNEPSTFHLVVPTHPDNRRIAWDETEAHVVARRRLEDGLAWLRETDPRADGEVGDVDPILAIDDALRETTYDSIVLAVGERPHRRRANVTTRVRQAFDLPVVDVLGTPQVLRQTA